VALARAGCGVFGVHLDRAAPAASAEHVAREIRALGREACFGNVNAADPERRSDVMDARERFLAQRGRPGGLRMLPHPHSITDNVIGVDGGEDIVG